MSAKKTAPDNQIASAIPATGDDQVIVDEQPAAPSFVPCACPCGCTAITTVPAAAGKAMARHARCASCAVPAHMSAHPTPQAQAVATRVNLTEVYVPSTEETAIARAAALEVYGEIWSSQWAAWQASLPEKFRDAYTEHAQVTERMRRLAAGERGVASLLVLGAPGLGKTFLSLGYANAAIRAGYFKPSEVLFGSESELLASAANSSFGEVEPALRRLISPRVKMLIIDDVGRGTWLNEAMRPKVFSLVLDKFWSQNRVVVFTSNLKAAELGDYIGDGAMDRLRSMVGNASLVLDTESKRRKVTDEMLARSKETPTPVVPPMPAA
jgi:DNA replication protein DnaC